MNPTTSQLNARNVAVGAPATPTGAYVPTDSSNGTGSTYTAPGVKAQPATEQTTITSGNINNTVIPDDQNRLTTLTNKGQTVGGDGLSRNADGTVDVDAARSAGGFYMGEDGNKYFNYDGSLYKDSSAFTSDEQSTFNDLKKNLDATTKQALDAAQQTHDIAVQKQNDINQRNASAGTASLLESNTTRYAPSDSATYLSAITKDGLDKIQALDADENRLIAQANQAQANGDKDILNTKLDLIEKRRAEKQAAVDKLTDATNAHLQDLQKQKEQADKDSAIAGEMVNGVTDPKQILANLQAKGNTTISAKDISDNIANMNPDAKAVTDIMTAAAKNGASQDILTAIGKSKTVAEAINAAGNSLQTATGTLGDYLQYKKDTEAQGLVAKDYQTYKDEQDQKASQAKINEAYATEDAKNQADANSTESDKVQQKLEQQYRTVLSKEFSSRTGALGVENSKVNQANHLNSLFSQYYDPKTGNYNIPKTQYAELAIGLGNLVSPTGVVSEGARDAIMQKTAAGDLNGAIAYITGSPQNGSSQDVFKNLIDSVDRQATTAISNREAALQNMRDQAPTDLDQSRIDQLNKSTQMVPYAGEDRVAKTNVDNFLKTSGSQTIQLSDGPHSLYYAVSQLYKVPGATNKDVEDYLKANGYIQ